MKSSYLIRTFLKKMLPPDLFESVEGDLAELYEEHYDTKGRFIANLLIIFNAIQFLQPFFIRNSMKHRVSGMYQNYWKVIIRSLRRTPVISSLRTVSALSKSCCI